MKVRWFVVAATAACLGGAIPGMGQNGGRPGPTPSPGATQEPSTTAPSTSLAPSEPMNTDPTPTETPAPTETPGESDSSDSNTMTIVLGSMLGVLVAANIAICAMYKAGCIGAKRKSESRALPTVYAPRNAPSADPNAATELAFTKEELATELKRRQYLEALVNRNQCGDGRLDAFPKPKQVAMHVEQAGDVVLGWTERAVRSVHGRPALPLTIRNVLTQTFLVCQERVQRCLDERLSHFQAFVGNGEKVTLSDTVTMRLDTRYVMYEILASNYEQIVPVGDGNFIANVSAVILERARGEGNTRGGQSVEEMIISGDLQSSFESVVKKYLITFVECALQNPPITFAMDDLGKVMELDAEVHRELAVFRQGSNSRRCCIVLPAMQPRNGLFSQPVRVGVVRVID